jgi:predicted hydrocarbon binding protein
MPSFAQIRDVSTVISILPIAIWERKPGLIPGEYRIPAVKDPRRDMNLLLVERAQFPVYIDENRPSLVVPEPSDKVCASIVRDFSIGIQGYEPDIAEPGLTWVPGEVTKLEIEAKMSEALADLRAKQEKWFSNLVEQADDDWGKYHMRRMISHLQRVACQILNLEREWNIAREIEKQSDIDMTPCKFCRAMVHHEAIVCQFCQGILNLSRYKAEYVSAATLRVETPEPTTK